jgi:hypothetical protein
MEHPVYLYILIISLLSYRSADGLGGSVGGDSHTPVHLGMLWEILEARDSARINRVMGREEDEEWRIPRDQMSSSHNRDTGSRGGLLAFFL